MGDEGVLGRRECKINVVQQDFDVLVCHGERVGLESGMDEQRLIRTGPFESDNAGGVRV